MDIDQISRRILAILQRDGRCPNTVIARDLGISEAAVRARIQALTAAGVLQIVGLTDPSNMGFGVIAMIGVQASNDLGRIAELVSTWPETTYVVISAGSFDLLIELVCTDNNDLLRVVERLRGGRRRPVDGVLHLHLAAQAQLRVGVGVRRTDDGGAVLDDGRCTPSRGRMNHAGPRPRTLGVIGNRRVTD